MWRVSLVGMYNKVALNIDKVWLDTSIRRDLNFVKSDKNVRQSRRMLKDFTSACLSKRQSGYGAGAIHMLHIQGFMRLSTTIAFPDVMCKEIWVLISC